MGRVANKKVIREAVVVVPFLEVEGERQFFSLSREQIQLALGETPTQATGDDIPGDSITQMVDAMQRYVMPPSMDFINYPDKVDPFSMYVFEFTHELNQQDLTDIWQNLPPRIGRAFSQDSNLETSEIKQVKQITHDLGRTDELLNGPLSPRLQASIASVLVGS